MSFLARSSQPLFRAARTPVAVRAFSVSAVRGKGPVDAAKDALKTVDRKVSDKLVGGIKAGETVAQKTGLKGHKAKKEFEEELYSEEGEVKGKMEDAIGEVKGKASELAGEAKGKAKEAEGKIKGKM
ncbi:hypothetical protein V493_07822 [Pseudogymnoascus sp. VKM F-4281 (FW-2241)]|nr:hypothetical protein V493_07822 [Pseudogymnoascus sp. VKM F-4281 (FW-2241)]